MKDENKDLKEVVEFLVDSNFDLKDESKIGTNQHGFYSCTRDQFIDALEWIKL